MNRFIKLTVLLGLLSSMFIVAACGSDSGGDSSNGSGSGDSSDTMLSTESFSKAFDAVKEKVGSDALIEVTVTNDNADFKLRKGSSDEAYGFSWARSSNELQPVKVKLIGAGTLDGQSFPLSKLDPAAIDKVISGSKEKAGSPAGFKVEVLTLKKPTIMTSPDEEPTWNIVYETDSRTSLSYQAAADGSNIVDKVAEAQKQAAKVTEQTQKQAADAAKQAEQISKQANDVTDCISKAAGDVEKIQKCTQK